MTRGQFLAKMLPKKKGCAGVIFNAEGFRKHNWWFRKGHDQYMKMRESKKVHNITDVRDKK